MSRSIGIPLTDSRTQRVTKKETSTQTEWQNNRSYERNDRQILTQLIVSVQKRYDVSCFGEWICRVTRPRKYHNAPIFSMGKYIEWRDINTADETIFSIFRYQIKCHYIMNVECSLWTLSSSVDTKHAVQPSKYPISILVLRLKKRWIWFSRLLYLIVQCSRIWWRPHPY